MVYLNYNQEHPISFEALDAYNKTIKENIFEPEKKNDFIKTEIRNIANMFNVMDSEIFFTSGITESNNLALLGTALANQKKGQRIIVSKLEDISVYKICDYLTSLGFKIDYVNNDSEGLIDFDDLKRLVKEDTILVSIAAVNSSLGIRQPLKMIRQIIKKENSQTLLHSDFSNAIGKVSINFHDVDLASISSATIGGPKGIGLLYKSDITKIIPINVASNNISVFENDLALIKSFSVALKNAVNDIEKKEHFVSRLNEKIVNSFKNMNICINNTNYSVSHIINITVNNNAGLIVNSLKDRKIFIGFNEGLDTGVMAVYNDKKRAINTIIISLSYKTTTDEVNEFLTYFIDSYNKYGV